MLLRSASRHPSFGFGCTEYLMKILAECGSSFATTEEREIGRDVKEKLCYVASDYDIELKSTAESSDKKQTHMLSDGNIITATLTTTTRTTATTAPHPPHPLYKRVAHGLAASYVNRNTQHGRDLSNHANHKAPTTARTAPATARHTQWLK